MTDLISQLADAIVSLNNASPRLPTKAEIEEALQPVRVAMDALMLQSYPLLTFPPMPYKDVTATTLELNARNAENALWQALTPSERANRPCPGYASEHHHWEVDPWSTREVGPEEVANLCVCGARKLA